MVMAINLPDKEALYQTAILATTEVIVKQMELYNYGKALSSQVITDITKNVTKSIFSGKTIKEVLWQMVKWCEDNSSTDIFQINYCKNQSNRGDITANNNYGDLQYSDEAYGDDAYNFVTDEQTDKPDEDGADPDYLEYAQFLAPGNITTTKQPTFVSNTGIQKPITITEDNTKYDGLHSYICLIENSHLKCYAYRYDPGRDISVIEPKPLRRLVPYRPHKNKTSTTPKTRRK